MYSDPTFGWTVAEDCSGNVNTGNCIGIDACTPTELADGSMGAVKVKQCSDSYYTYGLHGNADCSDDVSTPCDFFAGVNKSCTQTYTFGTCEAVSASGMVFWYQKLTGSCPGAGPDEPGASPGTPPPPSSPPPSSSPLPRSSPEPPCATPVDFVLVLDNSGSMKRPEPHGSMEGAGGLKDLAKQLVSHYALGVDAVRFAVVSFATDATTRVGWSYDAAEIHAGIDQMSADGKTSISDGFEAAGQLLNDHGRVGATKVVLIVTDGEQSVDPAEDKTLWQTAVDAAALVKEDGATVFAWGFGTRVGFSTLENIATDASKAILAQDVLELASYLELLQIVSICNTVVCHCSPPSPPPACTGPTFSNKESLKTAVTEYDSNPASAIAKYGAIANWCVAGVTDMSSLFFYLHNFNADISGWDTSRVTNMHATFAVRCSPRPARQPAVAPSPQHGECTPRSRTASRHPARIARPAPCALLATLRSPRWPSTSR